MKWIFILCCAGIWGQSPASQSAVKILKVSPGDETSILVLENGAKEAVEYPGPSFEAFGKDGQSSGLSPQFEEWCAKNGLDAKAESGRISRDLVPNLVALRLIPKSRALPILRKGLQSDLAIVSVTSAFAMRDWADATDIDLMLQELRKHAATAKYSNLETGFLIAFSTMDAAENHQALRRFLLDRNLAVKFDQFRLERKRQR